MQPDSKHGRTPPVIDRERADFYRAVHGGDLNAVDLFLAQKPEAARWRTPDGTPVLVLAMGSNDRDLWEAESRSYSHEEVIALLITYGADVNAADVQGRTPLIEECANDRRENIVALLLKNGANANAVDSLKTTALHFVAVEDYGDDLISPLVAAGANVNAQDWQGNTPLHLAAGEGACEFSAGHLDCVQRLLDCGASPDIRNSSFRTPLDTANMNADFQEDGKRPTAELILSKIGKRKPLPEAPAADTKPGAGEARKGPKPPPGKFRLKP
ncbi:MAG TPA: ankyrin repeat domain-containing protein [Patescibacteria group bacterium]|nr:ankyrin repeat domain-containing protein [Patescibacteria group bacterium]